MDDVLKRRKRAVRARQLAKRRHERRRVRERRLAELDCFWTWPWGHALVWMDGSYTRKKCETCPKVVYMSGPL